MFLRHTRTLSLVVLSLVLLPGFVMAAGGGSADSASLPTAPQMSPEAQAKAHYMSGLKARDKAWEFEEKAAGLEGSAAEKALKKMRKQFETAASFQRKAIASAPRAHQAHSSLGYALRRLGNYDESIAAYDMALSIQPQYAEAIEYRGEAYLGLGRLDDAKQAYIALFAMDQEKANELLEAMEEWVTDKRASAGSQEVEDFASWVAERSQLAEQSAMLFTGKEWK